MIQKMMTMIKKSTSFITRQREAHQLKALCVDKTGKTIF